MLDETVDDFKFDEINLSGYLKVLVVDYLSPVIVGCREGVPEIYFVHSSKLGCFR